MLRALGGLSDGMHQRRWMGLARLALVGALLTACGDDTGAGGAGQGGAGQVGSGQGGAGGAGAGGPGTLSELQDAWCPVYAERYCAAALGCGCSDVPGFSDAEGACLERAERGCRRQLDGFAAGVASGTLLVAGSVPEACLPTLEGSLAGCQLPPPDVFIVRCPLVWPAAESRELPGPGAPCAGGLCAEGARCGSAGSCVEPTPGGSCQSEADCLPGDHCGGDARCFAPDYGGPRVSCADPSECSGELSCLASARRECRAKQSGVACSGDEACVDTEYCEGGQCAPEPGLGEPCGAGVACAEGLGCRMGPAVDEGSCQLLPELGEPCALGRFGPFLCAEGLACNAQLCGLPPGVGEACAVGEIRCEPGLGCHVEGAESLCKPRVAEGEPCGLDDSCSVGLFCDFQVQRCRAHYELGAPCSAGNECGVEGSCVPDAQGDFRCVPRPTLGQACFLDECTEGLSCRSPYDAGLCAPPLCAAFPF